MTENYLIIEIPGEPVAKGRPRFCRNGHTFTPQKTVDHEIRVNDAARKAVKDKGWKMVPQGSPVALEMVFTMAMPKGWSEKEREARNQSACAKKIDLDNICKLACDGLNNSGIWHDDCQVTAIHAEKVWGDTGHTIITVVEL